MKYNLSDVLDGVVDYYVDYSDRFINAHKDLTEIFKSGNLRKTMRYMRWCSFINFSSIEHFIDTFAESMINCLDNGRLFDFLGRYDDFCYAVEDYIEDNGLCKGNLYATLEVVARKELTTFLSTNEHVLIGAIAFRNVEIDVSDEVIERRMTLSLSSPDEEIAERLRTVFDSIKDVYKRVENQEEFSWIISDSLKSLAYDLQLEFGDEVTIH